MKKLKIGFISFAHGHAYSYLNAFLNMPEVDIIGIADDVISRIEHIGTKHSIPLFEDYHELLKQDFDAVAICSENVNHEKHVIAAAEAGKHIICEKPLGLSVEQMERMIDTCKTNGVQLMTAFPCRYLAAVTNAKKVVDAGEIGDIIAFKGTNRGTMPGQWFVEPELSGGGALLDHTVHVMDLMNWFTGSKVKQVYAYAATLFHEELKVDDAGIIHVQFENGTYGVLDTSWSRPKSFPTWGDVTLEIIGTKGQLYIDSFAQSNEVYSDAEGKGVWSFWGDDMDKFMIKAFVDALLSGKQVPITGLDGLRSAEVALAGYRSLEIGQPVKL